jgi:hypothetical protein
LSFEGSVFLRLVNCDAPVSCERARLGSRTFAEHVNQRRVANALQSDEKASDPTERKAIAGNATTI